MDQKPPVIAQVICTILERAENRTMTKAELLAAASHVLRCALHLRRNINHMISRGQVARSGPRGQPIYTLVRGYDTRPVVARAGLPFRIMEWIFTGEDRRRTTADWKKFRQSNNSHLCGIAIKKLRKAGMIFVSDEVLELSKLGLDAMGRILDLSAIEASSVDVDGLLAERLDGDDIQQRIEAEINASAETKWARLMGDQRFDVFWLKPMPLVQYRRPEPIRSVTGSSAGSCADFADRYYS